MAIIDLSILELVCEMQAKEDKNNKYRPAAKRRVVAAKSGDMRRSPSPWDVYDKIEVYRMG